MGLKNQCMLLSSIKTRHLKRLRPMMPVQAENKATFSELEAPQVYTLSHFMQRRGEMTCPVPTKATQWPHNAFCSPKSIV